MRKEDHERIAEAVASTKPSYFSPEILAKLKEGSIWPDQIRIRMSHHNYRESDITKNIIHARKLFLQGNLTDSAFHLGVAFHYIADGTCPGSKDSRHNSWEAAISRLSLPKKIYYYNFTTPNQIFHHIDSELLVKRRTQNSSLFSTLNLCCGILESVWKSVENKNKQEEELINQVKSELPDKLSYNISIFIIFIALSLNIFLVSILDAFQIFLSLIATGIVSSIPFRRLYKRKQAVIWILDWYGIHY